MAAASGDDDGVPSALASIIHQVDRPDPGVLDAKPAVANGGHAPQPQAASPSTEATEADQAVPAQQAGRSGGGICAWLSGIQRACASVCPCAGDEKDARVSVSAENQASGARRGGTQPPTAVSSASSSSPAVAAASPQAAAPKTPSSASAVAPAQHNADKPAGGKPALAAASVAAAPRRPQRSTAPETTADPPEAPPSSPAHTTTNGSPSKAAAPRQASSPSTGSRDADQHSNEGARASSESKAPSPSSSSSSSSSSTAPGPLPPPPAPSRTLPGFRAISVPVHHRHAISRKDPLLPAPLQQHSDKMCLVLDLDETLVHSNFKPVRGADLVVPVKLAGTVHPVHVMTRPGWQPFLEELAQHYELVVFTASVDYYANPLLDRLDPGRKLITHRLFRESCVLWQGSYIKDMSLLGRDERRSIIVDNSPASYLLHPQNALPCSSFFDDKADNELPRLCRFLVSLARRNVVDVRQHLIEWASFDDGGLGEDDTDIVR